MFRNVLPSNETQWRLQVENGQKEQCQSQRRMRTAMGERLLRQGHRAKGGKDGY